MTILSLEEHKASRYIEWALVSFLKDPPDSSFQRGYLAALLAIYREGLGKGVDDERMTMLHAFVDRSTPEQTYLLDGGAA
jgi:hypothetical protein